MTVDNAKTRLIDLLQSKSKIDQMIEDLQAEARVLKKRLQLDDQIVQYTFLKMSFNCNGICEMGNCNSQFIKGYSNGQRYCKTCCAYVLTDSFRCECCNQVLRQSSRYTTKIS